MKVRIISGIFWGWTCSLALPLLGWQFDRAESWRADPGVDLMTESAGIRTVIQKKPDWNKPSIQFNLREKSSEKNLGSPEKIDFSLELLDGSGVTVALYLKDANGEFFSYPQKPLKPGVNAISWQIQKDFNGNWGEDKDGKVDPPVKLEAVILHQYPAEKAASLRFRNPNAQEIPGVGVSVQELQKFDDTARWEADRNLVYTPHAEGLVVQAAKMPKPGEQGVIGRMREVSFPLQNIGSPSALELDVERLAGSGVNLALELTDASGESFALKQKPVPEGRSRMAWDLHSDIAGSWGQNKDGKIDFPIMFNNITFFQYPAEKPGEILFRSLGKREELRDVDAVSFRYETNSPLPILKVGDESKFGLSLTNHYQKKTPFTIQIDLRNYRGDTLHFERKFELAPAETIFWQLPWDPKNARGVWRANIEFASADGLRSRRDGRTSFAYMAPAGPNNIDNPEFILGYNMRQQHWSKQDQRIEANAAALSGGKLLRTGYTWEGIEREEGVFDFTAADELMALNNSLGMEHMFLVAYTPYFASRPETRNTGNWNDWNKSVPDGEKLETFCRKLADHYRGKIRFYEFWNEPDLEFWIGNLDEYLDRLKHVYRGIKETDPTAYIISGGIASDLPRSKPGFHKGLVERGQDDFDFHGYHQHGDFSTYERILAGPVAEYRKQLKSDKPLFFTETGFYISNGNYMQQAVNVVKKIVHARVLGARGYIWFDLRDDGFLPGYCEHNYGLLTHDWFPKEGYAAYNTSCLQLAKAKFGGTLVKNERSTAHWFQDGADQVIVVWKTNAKGVEEPLTVQTDASHARFIDIMGNETPAAVVAGRVTLPMPEYPGYLRLTDAKTPPRSGQSVVRPAVDGMAAAPGKPLDVPFHATNPLDRETEFRWKWQLPAGVAAVPGEGALSLKPGQNAELAAAVTVPESASGSVLRLALDYQLGAESGKAVFPLNIASRIAAGAYPAKPQFVLNDREHMVSQMEHNPYTSHRIWSGPADQSAEIFLATGNETLKIQVRVTDGVHVKSKTAAGCYMEDGLQLALAVPGQPGHWEFGFAELEDGSPGTHVWIQPDGFAAPQPSLAVSHPAPNQTVYEIELPFNALGITPERLKAGIQFNLLINENDGEGRDGWLQIAPGIGEAKVPEKYPFILL